MSMPVQTFEIVIRKGTLENPRFICSSTIRAHALAALTQIVSAGSESDEGFSEERGIPRTLGGKIWEKGMKIL